MDGTTTFYVWPITTPMALMSQHLCSNPFMAVGVSGAGGLGVPKSAVAGKSDAYECVAIQNPNMAEAFVKGIHLKIKNAIHNNVVSF